jgi:hypothetical protein
MALLVRLCPLVLLLACLDSFAPAGAAPFTPPAAYRAWWSVIAVCAGISGDFDRVEWYQVPDATYPCPAYAGRCAGWWRPPHDIYLAEVWLADRQLVEHEMLHDLLQRGDHPPVFEACGVARPGA